jgi:hypothetical protein
MTWTRLLPALALLAAAAPAHAVDLRDLALLDVVNATSLPLCAVNVWKDKKREAYNFIRGDRIFAGQTKKLIDAVKPGRYSIRIVTCSGITLVDQRNVALHGGTNQILAR